MKTTTAASVLLTLVLAAQAASSQTKRVPASVSPAVFSKIVETILRDEFRPANKARSVYISDQMIEASWLPKISNIQFVMLNAKEFEEHGKAHLFSEAALENGMLRVDFGFGDHCSAVGDSFYFQITGDKFKIVGRNNGWGRGCGSGTGED